MASVYVTFTDAVREHPVIYGKKGRTEVLNIEASTAEDETTLDANAGENIVSVYAEAACWVAIGDAPDPESANRHFIAAGERRDFWIDADQKVSIVSA